MTDREQSLEAGLYFVATPIGAARDITLRGLDILRQADVLAAEDTRNTRRLLDIHGIALEGRKLIAYHDHNGPKVRPRLIGMIREGLSVAYVSDAGTPLVADPGYALARAATEAGFKVVAAPGASAVLAALTVAGLPTDRFLFAGFLPPRQGARKALLENLESVPATLVFFESPKRVGKTLDLMAQVLGPEREAALCRELTKKFEETVRGTLGELAERYAQTPPRGEVVLLVGPPVAREADDGDIRQAVRAAIEQGASRRDAVDRVARDMGVPRRRVYALALEGKE